MEVKVDFLILEPVTTTSSTSLSDIELEESSVSTDSSIITSSVALASLELSCDHAGSVKSNKNNKL